MSDKKKNAANYMGGGEGEHAPADPKEKMAVVGGLLQELNSINQMMDSFKESTTYFTFSSRMFIWSFAIPNTNGIVLLTSSMIASAESSISCMQQLVSP